MRTSKRRSLLLLMISIICLSLAIDNSKLVFADSNGLPFMVEPVLPKNQDEDVSSYISLVPEDGVVKQNVEFKITNESEVDQEIKINVVDAYTSPNGVIQYVEKESDNSVIANEAYKLSNYLKVDENNITLKAGETRIVSGFLNANDLEGVLLGGVSFSAIEEGETEQKDNSSFKINNEINMVIGVMINFDTTQEANFIIEDPFLDPMPSYFAIRLPISLDSPLLVKDSEVKYQVKNKGEKLFSGQKEFSFAPFTKVNMSIPFEHEEIKNNETYEVIGEIIYKDKEGNEIKKDFEGSFKYRKEKEVNENTSLLKAPVEKSNFPMWGVLVVIIPMVVIVFLVYRNRKLRKTIQQ